MQSRLEKYRHPKWLLFLVLSILLAVPHTRAQNNPANSAPVVVVSPDPGWGWGGRTYLYPLPPGIPIFDDSVFNLKEAPGPAESAEGRWMDDAEDYSRAQRESWIESCRKSEDSSFEEFRACFARLRDQYLEGKRN